jgi:iron(III) transport system permease protein
MDARAAIARFRDGERDAPSLALTLLAGAVAALLVSPLLWLVLRALGASPAAWDLLVSDTTLTVLVTSVALVAVVTAGAVLLGVPLAVLTVQTDLPFRRFWTVVGALPLVVPSYIGAFAFVSAFGPRGELAGLLGLPIPTIYGFGGTALVLTLFTYPYVFLTTRASLLSLDATLVEAAQTLDHTRWEAFRAVTVPQILPGVAAGALLVALYTLADFGTPNIMRLPVFTQTIYAELTGFQQGYAALLSLQLLAVTAVILALENRVGVDDSEAYASRAGGTSLRITLGPWRWVALLFAAAVATLCLVVPVAILLHWLARGGVGYAGGGLSFSWAFGLNSMYASALAALVATLLAVPVAFLSATADSRLATLIDRATYVGYAVPGIVLGLALVTLGLRAVPALYQTVPMLVFAYVVRFIPQSVGSIRSSVLQVDRRLIEAARTLGRKPGGAFRAVTLPLIAPGVAAGAALVFLTSMKELPATLLLSPIGFDTLVTYIWRVQEAGYYGQAALPALVLVGVSGLSMAVILAREGRYG